MCRRILGTILFLFVLVGIGVIYLASRPPATHARILTGKVQQARAERRVQNALQNPTPIESASAPTQYNPMRHDSATLANPDQQYTVRLSEDDINTILATSPAVLNRLQRAKIDSASVEFGAPDKLVLTAQLPVGGSERVLAVSGTLSATDTGDVAFHSDAAQVGMLPLPISSNTKIDNRAAQLIALAMPKLPISVRTISVSNGVLILTGPRRAG